MADGYVGSAFIECENYTLLDQYVVTERYPDGIADDWELECYCGADAPIRAKVCFHQKMREDDEYGWGNSITMEHTVDRCEHHKFEDTDD